MIDVKDELTEEEWWNIYGDVQEQVWVYDDYFEKKVRAGYLQEMDEFLFKPEGRILDFGCGTGWIGLRFAQKGMQVEGIDISAEQIKQARQQAHKLNITHAQFWQGGVETLETLPNYDGIIVHSLLHHLSRRDKEILLRTIANKLVEGGRAYFYEPIAAKPGSSIAGRVSNKIVLGILWGMRRLAYWLHLQDQNIREAVRAGWTMQSPDESPIDLEQFKLMLPSQLTLTNVTYWHMAAVAYANLCMGLKPGWRRLARSGIVLFQAVDHLLLSRRYRNYMRAWPMASMMITKMSNPYQT